MCVCVFSMCECGVYVCVCGMYVCVSCVSVFQGTSVGLDICPVFIGGIFLLSSLLLTAQSPVPLRGEKRNSFWVQLLPPLLPLESCLHDAVFDLLACHHLFLYTFQILFYLLCGFLKFFLKLFLLFTFQSSLFS